MDAMQGDIWGEHIEEMKMVVMRDSVRVSRHLLSVRFDNEDGFVFSKLVSCRGCHRPKTGLGRCKGCKMRFISRRFAESLSF